MTSKVDATKYLKRSIEEVELSVEFKDKFVILFATEASYQDVEFGNFKKMALSLGANKVKTMWEADEDDIATADIFLGTAFILLPDPADNTSYLSGKENNLNWQRIIHMYELNHASNATLSMNNHLAKTYFILNDFLYDITLPDKYNSAAFGREAKRFVNVGEIIKIYDTQRIISMFDNEDTRRHLDLTFNDEYIEENKIYSFDFQKIAANSIGLPNFKHSKREYAFTYIGGSRYGGRSKFLSEVAQGLSSKGLKSFFGGHIANSFAEIDVRNEADILLDLIKKSSTIDGLNKDDMFELQLEAQNLNMKIGDDENITLHHDFINGKDAVREYNRDASFAVLPRETGYGQAITSRFFEGLQSNVLLVHESWLQNECVQLYAESVKQNTGFDVVYNNAQDVVDKITSFYDDEDNETLYLAIEKAAIEVVKSIQDFNDWKFNTEPTIQQLEFD